LQEFRVDIEMNENFIDAGRGLKFNQGMIAFEAVRQIVFQAAVQYAFNRYHR
jgi:hypothetical protein